MICLIIFSPLSYSSKKIDSKTEKLESIIKYGSNISFPQQNQGATDKSQLDTCPSNIVDGFRNDPADSFRIWTIIQTYQKQVLSISHQKKKSKLKVQLQMSEDYYIYEEEEDQPLSSYINIELHLDYKDHQQQHQTKGKATQEKTEKKNKQIRKKDKKGKAEQKLKKRKKEDIPTGRPNNLESENEHLIQNRSYNDIVYHYARLLIFLKLLPQSPRLPLDLPPAHATLLADTRRALLSDPFPSPHQHPLLLLHPSSLHSMLFFQREKFAKISYSSSQMKSMVLILLESKQLLSQSVVDYLNDYWNDIVFLVNHPQDGAADIQQQPEDYQADLPGDDVGRLDDMGFLEEDQPLLAVEPQGNEGKRKKLAPSEEELMRREYSSDRSIIAYEIACYIYACCCKYAIAVTAEP